MATYIQSEIGMKAHKKLIETTRYANLGLQSFKATVISQIWHEVLFFTLVATIVTLVSELTPHELSLSSAMLTVLGTVLGLVISFRTSSAYERYMEGRKYWTSIAIASRNLAHIIWLHVPFKRTKEKTEDSNKDSTQDLTKVLAKDSTQDSTQNPIQDEYTVQEITDEKKSMIKLVQAYSVSVKHLLRGEYRIDYEDLDEHIRFLPFYSQALEKQKQSSKEGSKEGMVSAMKVQERQTAPSPLPSPRAGDVESLGPASSSWSKFGSWRTSVFSLRKTRPIIPFSHRKADSNRTEMRPTSEAVEPKCTEMHLTSEAVASNVPNENSSKTVSPDVTREDNSKDVAPNVPHQILLFISHYLAWLIKEGKKNVPPATAAAAWNAISSLQDSVANLDRIKKTPLPIAYQAHLRISLWIYLFFLPSQVWSSFRYLTIPGTAFASFLLLGFLEIGQEIEDPFNYDKNDLDLDAFCASIQQELQEIMEHEGPDLNNIEWPHQHRQADTKRAKNTTALK